MVTILVLEPRFDFVDRGKMSVLISLVATKFRDLLPPVCETFGVHECTRTCVVHHELLHFMLKTGILYVFGAVFCNSACGAWIPATSLGYTPEHVDYTSFYCVKFHLFMRVLGAFCQSFIQ